MTDIVEQGKAEDSVCSRTGLPHSYWPQGNCQYCGKISPVVESLRSRAEKAEAERYQLALAICGGEDAPGYLDSIPVETIVDVARSNHSSHMNDIDRLMKAEATCEKLAKALESARTWVEPKNKWHDENAKACRNLIDKALSEYRKEASE